MEDLEEIGERSVVDVSLGLSLSVHLRDQILHQLIDMIQSGPKEVLVESPDDVVEKEFLHFGQVAFVFEIHLLSQLSLIREQVLV